MAFTDSNHVITGNGVIIWEAVTKPDIKENSGKQNWNLRVAMPTAAVEVGELQQLVQQTLQASKDPQVSVSNPGNNPISPVDLSKFPELPETVCFTASTTQAAPPVFDANGKQLEPMVYGPMLYNGAVVRLLVHSYLYNNKQKGVNFGLDGVQIIDAKAPRLSIGQAGLGVAAVAAAFGGSAAPAPAPATTEQAAPPAPNTSYMVPPPPPVAAVFPPEGWLAHPGAPGYFYKGQEVLTEADLRARG